MPRSPLLCHVVTPLAISLVGLLAALGGIQPSVAQDISRPATVDDLRALERSIAERPTAAHVLPLVPTILSAARHSEEAAEALRVLERAIDVLLPDATGDGDYHHVAAMLETAARLRFQQVDPGRAEQHLHSLLGLYRAARLRTPPQSDPLAWPRQLIEVATAFLHGDRLNQALPLLAEVAELDLPAEHFIAGYGSVSAALNRRLEALTTDQRYDLLYHWVMPGEGPTTVRVWSSVTPLEAPPAVFARALGERPSGRAFPVPQVNRLEGLFSVEWQLVRAAEQSGRLRRLITELEGRVQQGVPNAEYLLLLARIAAADEKVDEALLEELSQRLDQSPLTSDSRGGSSRTPATRFDRETTWAVIAAACMAQDWLLPHAQSIFERLSREPAMGRNAALKPFFRRAAADSVLRRYSDQSFLLDRPDLKLWIPTRVDQGGQELLSETRSVWIEQEGHILRLTGPGDDYLCFRYPLSGDFQFQVDAHDGGAEWAQSQVTFDGSVYAPSGRTNNTMIKRIGRLEGVTRHSPFIRRETWPAYQRLTLQVSGLQSTFLINGHPIWSGSRPDHASPWLGLSSPLPSATVFRNLRLTGAVIPREVHLSAGDQLSGWYGDAHEEVVQVHEEVVQPRVVTSSANPAELPGIGTIILQRLLGRRPATEAPATQTTNETASVRPPGDVAAAIRSGAGLPWRLADGVILGEPTDRSPSAPANHLTYFRPLQNGESIEYEFYYEPERQHVHPALGRLVFLIEPGGVRVRWRVQGDRDWTGLSDDHAVTEPLNRRGPRPLPLKPAEWNRLHISMSGDAVTLNLNDTEIYVRQLEPENSRAFGLYRDHGPCLARVRNVIMRGDWPERLTDSSAGSLVAGNSARTHARQQALGELFAERHILDSALWVHRQAMAMPAEQRFDYLAAWVLPGPDHAALRLALDFTPTNPSPPAMDRDALDQLRLDLAARSGRSAVQLGGNLVSPALDLVETARELGKLDEIRRRVEQAPAAEDGQRRAKLAMLALIDIARQDFQLASESLFLLFALVESGEHTDFVQRWPETLAIHAALPHAETRDVGRDIAYQLFLRQTRSGEPSGSETWRRQVTALAGLASWLDLESGDKAIEAFMAEPPLKQWRGMSVGNAKSFGLGFPRAHWHLHKDGPENLASHGHDYLIFQSPLYGNFEVQCEVPAFGWRDTQLSVAGRWAGVLHTRDAYDFGDFHGTISRVPFQPPLRRVVRTLSYRVVVRDGTVTTSVNGRQLCRLPLGEHHVPWLSIRAPREKGSAKDIRITGQPEIPAEIRLSSAADLNGWISYHDDPSLRGAQPLWRRVTHDVDGAEIVGLRREELAGSHAENLLRYCRPMWEDGTIEYEFYYREGSSHCHPAIGRLAFLLHRSEVREHWITDGPFDRTDIAPDNEQVIEENRIGPSVLPLQDNSWNRIRLTLEGDTVLLALNGQEVYRRDLEPTNQREFGLFHYADQNEAKVRQITWRGQWPRELPPLASQELAEDEVGFLDSSLAELPAKFTHDFARAGMPEDRIRVVHGEVPNHFELRPDGLLARREGSDGYHNSTVAPRLRIEGDFDVTVAYERLTTQAATPGSASVILSARFEGEAAQECTLLRRQTFNDTGFEQHFFHSAHVYRQSGETRRNYSPSVPFEAEEGQLRLARRGAQVYFLIAEGDSPTFRLVRTERVGDQPLKEDGIYMMAQTHMPGSISVVWKSIAIHADSLTFTWEQSLETVAALDERRAKLAAQFTHDFTKDAWTASRFHHWAFQPATNPKPIGQRVIGVAADDWKSAGVAAKLAMHGDFDIALEFDILRIDLPRENDSSSVYLQVEFPGEGQLQTSAIAMLSSTGSLSANAQLRQPDNDGRFTYPSLRKDSVDKIQRLRLARRGSRLYYLYSTDATGPDVLLGECDVPDGPVAANQTRFLVHTGGAGRVTEVVWKELSIRADEITPAE
jgi:hypothetical protein